MEVTARPSTSASFSARESAKPSNHASTFPGCSPRDAAMAGGERPFSDGNCNALKAQDFDGAAQQLAVLLLLRLEVNAIGGGGGFSRGRGTTRRSQGIFERCITIKMDRSFPRIQEYGLIRAFKK